MRGDDAMVAISEHWASEVTLTKNRGCRKEHRFIGSGMPLINAVCAE